MLRKLLLPVMDWLPNMKVIMDFRALNLARIQKKIFLKIILVAAYFGIYRRWRDNKNESRILNNKPMFIQLDTLPERWERRFYSAAYLYYNGLCWRVYSRERQEE